VMQVEGAVVDGELLVVLEVSAPHTDTSERAVVLNVVDLGSGALAYNEAWGQSFTPGYTPKLAAVPGGFVASACSQTRRYTVTKGVQ